MKKVRAIKENSALSEERGTDGEGFAQVSVKAFFADRSGCDGIRFLLRLFDNSPVSFENKNLLGGSM